MRSAVENGWHVTVAVVDEGGLLQALGRMDGAPPLSAQIAEAKAVGAALWHRDGDELAAVQADRAAFFAQVSSAHPRADHPGRRIGRHPRRRNGAAARSE